MQQYALKFLHKVEWIFKNQKVIKKGLGCIALLILCGLAYKLKGHEKAQKIVKLQDLVEFEMKDGFEMKATTVI